MRRARKDLSSAQFIRSADLDAAYTLLYDCMLHVGLAYMAVSGVRPEMKGKHRTVIHCMGYILGKGYEEQIHFYDHMRRKRHQLIYEPGPYEATKKEFEDGEKVAKGFLTDVSKRIREENPQKSFDF
ncbi:MAG: hypothetical protein HY211_07290 [Candidatus Omnitrophica bacterium]|nr:hypothetical protein [Candidatus Omnitrophota bacterium]